MKNLLNSVMTNSQEDKLFLVSGTLFLDLLIQDTCTWDKSQEDSVNNSHLWNSADKPWELFHQYLMLWEKLPTLGQMLMPTVVFFCTVWEWSNGNTIPLSLLFLELWAACQLMCGPELWDCQLKDQDRWITNGSLIT